MSQRKGSPTSPPAAWVTLLLENHRVVQRVRMLWRRGKVPYRPLVPDHLNVDELTEDDLEEFELPETHFDWSIEPPESPTARRDAIQAIVNHLWDIAGRWTRLRGDWCDFQLIAYDGDGEELFAVGRRLKIDDEPPDPGDGDEVPHAPAPGPGPTRAPTVAPAQPARATISPEWRELHAASKSELGELLDHLKADRDDALARSRSMQDDVYRLWKQVHEASQVSNQVLRETVAHEREQVQLAREENSGRLKLQAHAITEMERSRRFGEVLGFAGIVFDSAVAHVVPLAREFVANMNNPGAPNPGAQNQPEFRWAQQAMAFLVLDMTPTQLEIIFNNDLEAAGAFVGRLNDGAVMKVEHDALRHVLPVLRILRSKRFRDLALPEQQLAARFIIKRASLHQMTEYGEDESQEGSTSV